jgi:hypothetical protein
MTQRDQDNKTTIISIELWTQSIIFEPSMMKRRSIAFLLTGILMVILVHNVVPHHHHFDSILSHRNCRQQDEGKNNKHPGDPRSHCHAFNGMKYYPTPETQNPFKPHKKITYLFFNDARPPAQSVRYREIFHPTGDILLLPARFPDPSSGLRAPPAIS